MPTPETFLPSASRTTAPPGDHAAPGGRATTSTPTKAPGQPSTASHEHASASGIEAMAYETVVFEALAIPDQTCDGVTVQVSGHLDESTAAYLDAVLTGQMVGGRRRIRLDVSRLSSATLAGVAPIHLSSRRCKHADVELSLVGAGSMVHGLLGSHDAGHDDRGRTALVVDA